MVSPDQLKDIPFFRGISTEVLELLAAGAHERTFESGVFLLHQHAEASTVYFLVSGVIQFLIRFEGVDDLLVGTSSEYGAPIGWSVVREPFRYTASARCETACRVISIPRDLFDNVIVEHPVAGYEILTRLALVLADRLEQARDMLIASPKSRPV